MKMDEDFEKMKVINERLSNLEIQMYELKKKQNRNKIFGKGYSNSMDILSGRTKS